MRGITCLVIFTMATACNDDSKGESPDGGGSPDGSVVIDATPPADADPAAPDADPNTPDAAPPPDAEPPDAALPAIEIGDCKGVTPVATITTAGLTFSPNTLTIRAGDTFKFETTRRHNIASPDGAPPDKTFSSGEPGAQTRCLTFRVPGEYPFVCTPHVMQGMTGTLTVTE